MSTLIACVLSVAEICSPFALECFEAGMATRYVLVSPTVPHSSIRAIDVATGAEAPTFITDVQDGTLVYVDGTGATRVVVKVGGCREVVELVDCRE